MVSEYCHVRQSYSAPLRQIYMNRVGLFCIRRGRKAAAVDGSTFIAGLGAVIVLSAGCFADVTNLSDPDGVYEADAFFVGSPIVASTLPGTPGARFGCFSPSAGFEHSLSAAREALRAGEAIPSRIVDHRVAELLVWAHAFGLTPTASDHDSPAIRLRHLICADPGRAWRIGDLASDLGMSESTLRRHLAAEGTSATDIIADVRLSRALAQLQSTNLPITQIAFDAGYQSPSRFSARFRARFGCSPGKIRGRRSKDD